MFSFTKNFLKKKDGNIFVSIIIILFILSLLGLSGLLYWEKDKVSQKYMQLMEKSEAEKRELKDKIYKVKIENEKNLQKVTNLESKIKETKTSYENLKIEYKKFTELKSFIEEKFSTLSSNTEATEKALQNVANKLEQGVAQLNAFNAKFSKQIKTKSKTSKKKKKKSILAGDSIPAVVVKDNGNKQVISKGTTTINTADRPILNKPQLMSINREHNFVIVNKGVVDGLKVDDVFIVLRNNEEIGQVKVSEIRDFVSLALMINNKPGFMLKVGDEVKKK